MTTEFWLIVITSIAVGIAWAVCVDDDDNEHGPTEEGGGE